MTPEDKDPIRFAKNRKGIIAFSLAFTVFGIVFILFTGRYELAFFVIAAILPWAEYWFRRNRR
ncbi:MAG TPA: hypothetical protein VLZ74_05965 [Methylocella sp.]|nr:hypothetical protein [Methylocella sp.]